MKTETKGPKMSKLPKPVKGIKLWAVMLNGQVDAAFSCKLTAKVHEGGICGKEPRIVEGIFTPLKGGK